MLFQTFVTAAIVNRKVIHLKKSVCLAWLIEFNATLAFQVSYMYIVWCIGMTLYTNCQCCSCSRATGIAKKNGVQRRGKK